MNVYYFSSCMEPVPFRFVPCVSVPRETPLRSHTHTHTQSPSHSLLLPGSADADFFIQCSTQSYNLTVILLQHLIKINKCMSLLERSALLTAGSLCCSGCPGFCLLLFALCPRRASSRPCCQRAQAAGAWANGAWFCGSIKFILSVGIKIKMLVICLGFLFTCCASLFFIAAEMATLENKNWLRGQRGKLHCPLPPVPVRASNQA